MCSLFCEYIHNEYVRIHVIYRGNQAEYVIHILVVAPHENVNTYSTRRVLTCGGCGARGGGWAGWECASE